MKLKSGFVLHSVAGEHVVVAVEERTEEFCGMIRLNNTGAFLWRELESGSDEEKMKIALIVHYGITPETADKAVALFISQLSEASVLEQ